MDFISMLFSDAVVASAVAVIGATCIIMGYLSYYFIKNVIKANPQK